MTGKSEIVYQRHVSFSNRTSKIHTIPITIDENLARQLAPAGRLLVWYPQGLEIIADSTDFGVATTLKNKVCLIMI